MQSHSATFLPESDFSITKSGRIAQKHQKYANFLQRNLAEIIKTLSGHGVQKGFFVKLSGAPDRLGFIPWVSQVYYCLCLWV
jgi:hypothetical protein